MSVNLVTETQYISTPIEKGIWQGYGRSDTEEEVREAFKKKFGYEPKVANPTGGCWNVGPIKEE